MEMFVELFYLVPLNYRYWRYCIEFHNLFLGLSLVFESVMQPLMYVLQLSKSTMVHYLMFDSNEYNLVKYVDEVFRYRVNDVN